MKLRNSSNGHFLRKLCFALLVNISSTNAQDVIILQNGHKIKAKEIEITSPEIRYKQFEYPDGHTWIVNKIYVHAINYENGTHVIINPLAEKTDVVVPPQQEKKANKRTRKNSKTNKQKN